MGKITFIMTVVLGVIFFIPHQLTAQKNETVISFNPSAPEEFFSFFNDKKHFISIRLNDISIKAMRHFVTAYTNAENEQWYKTSEGFVVSFTEDSVQKKVVYDLKGGWCSTLTAFSETQLPADIKELVNSAYPDFNIIIVYEIENRANSAYIVKIESKTKIKVLQIINGAMQETADYIKG